MPEDCNHLEIEEVTLYDCPPDEVTFCLDCDEEWRPDGNERTWDGEFRKEVKYDL